MVAPISSARVGSGGISVDVTFNTDPAKAKLSDLRNVASQAVKDLRIAPKVDFEETAFRRGFDSMLRTLDREKAKIRIAVELDRQGLADEFIRLGKFSSAQIAAIRPPGRSDALSPADISRLQSDITYGALGRSDLNSIQAAIMRSENRGFSLRNADSAVGLTNARVGSSADFMSARRSAAALAPEVEMTSKMRAKESVAAAREEYSERLDLEKKFQEGIDKEAAKGKNKKKRDAEESIDNLRDLIHWGAKAVLITEAIGAGIGVARVGQGIAGAAFSSDVNNRRAGVVSAIQGAESIPIVGGLIGSLDKLYGVTESLNRAMSSRVEIEGRAVSIAALSRDPVAAAAAQGMFDLTQTGRRLDWMNHPFANPGRFIVGSMTGEDDEELANLKQSGEENSLRLLLAGRERTAARRGLGTAAYVAGLQRGRTPLAAQRAALAGQLANDLTLAPDYLKSYTAARNAAVLGNFDFQQAFDIGNLNFQSSTRIGAATLRARNHGVRLADEDALTTLRGLQYNINTASNDTAYRQGTTGYSFKDIAVSEAIAEARALKASLLPRGGAVAGAVNPIGTRIGDPYGIIPEIAARGRAMSFTEGALARWGGAGSGTGFPSAYPVGGGPSSEDKVDLMVRLLQDIRDALGGAYDAGSN